MKRLYFGAVLFVAMLGVVFWLDGRALREIRTEIAIGAPPAEVWPYLEKISEWPDWSPIVQSAEGEASEVAVLKITMYDFDGTVGPSYTPMITHIETNKHLAWRAAMLSSLFVSNGKILKLDATDSGTRLLHIETFSGMLVPIFWGRFERNVPTMLNAMNGALKEVVEKSWRERTPPMSE